MDLKKVLNSVHEKIALFTGPTLEAVILQQILPLANKTTYDDYSTIFLFHPLIYSLGDEGILLEIMPPYRSHKILSIPFFFVCKGRIRFLDTDRQQSSETQEPFPLSIEQLYCSNVI